jgi:hypothetical protein
MLQVSGLFEFSRSFIGNSSDNGEIRRKLPCDYLSASEQNRNVLSTPDVSPYGHLDDSHQAGPQSIDLPTILFLDPSLLQHGQVDVSHSAPSIPDFILQMFGDMDEIQSTASDFFDHIHLWMPFISKKKFYESHLRSAFRSRPDLVLLLLSVKLITQLPPTSPRNPRTVLYHTVKRFYLEVESSSLFSVPILQAGVLLVLYELGHGIYPAAFLTIGACARYAHSLGINGGRALVTRRALTLVDVEERRRVYWAIIILDRFVSVGCPGRPFATADPGMDDFLPADDAAWDQGVTCPPVIFLLPTLIRYYRSVGRRICQCCVRQLPVI